MVVKNGNLALVVAMTAMLGASAQGVVVYEQEYVLGTVVGQGLVADGAPGQFFDQRVADDFVLGTSTTVNGVSWVGGGDF